MSIPAKNQESPNSVWIVLVRGGRVVGSYQGADGQAAGCDAKRLEDDGAPVEVFEVGTQQAQPPPTGTAVDPAALGWIARGRLSCR